MPDQQPCYCHVRGILEIISRKYAIQLICLLADRGPLRYGDIEGLFGDVSSSTLSTRLDDLADANLISRERYDEIPPRVEYDLTDRGRELGERLEPLIGWVETFEEGELADGSGRS